MCLALSSAVVWRLVADEDPDFLRVVAYTDVEFAQAHSYDLLRSYLKLLNLYIWPKTRMASI